MRKTLYAVVCLLLVLVMTGCGPFMGGKTPVPDPFVPPGPYEPPAGYKIYYVAPDAEGTGDGSTPENAAYFRNSTIWTAAQQSLQASPVIVNFVPGNYVFSKKTKDGKSRDTLILKNMGHNEHVLIIQGMYQEGTIFMSDPDEGASESLTIDLLFFDGGKNAVFRNLHFTGQQYMGYTTKFYGTNVLIEDCTFIDLPRVVYGATGAHHKRSSYITWKNNTFKRIGYRSGSHMIYNAYDPTYIYVINNYFEDCAGEYVRFRDATDYAVAFGNTFKSTGTYTNRNVPFISVPLFNDDNPANPGPSPNYEYFGTHMLIANNTFIYPDDNTSGTRLVFRFYQTGWNPPGVQYYLTATEANTLKSGTLTQKRALMQSHLGLDATQIYFYGNTYVGRNSKPLVEFQAVPNYGATHRGFTGPIDITATLNTTVVVLTAEDAMTFWQ